MWQKSLQNKQLKSVYSTTRNFSLAKFKYSYKIQVTDEQWEELGQLSNEEKRFKYFHFLQIRESWKKKRQETKRAKREHSNAHHEEVLEEIQTNPHISYGNI